MSLVCLLYPRMQPSKSEGWLFGLITALLAEGWLVEAA